MGNKLRHEGDEVRIKAIWPECVMVMDLYGFCMPLMWFSLCFFSICSLSPKHVNLNPK